MECFQHSTLIKVMSRQVKSILFFYFQFLTLEDGKALQLYVRISHTITKFGGFQSEMRTLSVSLWNLICSTLFHVTFSSYLLCNHETISSSIWEETVFPKENLPKSVLDHFCVSTSPLCRVN